MRRLAIYIDGGPFTDAVRGQSLSMDMDYTALLHGLLAEGDEIVSADFITPEYPAIPYPLKHRNEMQRYKKLAAHGIAVHLCPPQIIGSVFVDRGIEALMTVKLITEAPNWDAALVISRRAELAPAITAVRRMGKAVDLAYFTFKIDPVNPLSAVTDRQRIITVDEVAALRISGPRPLVF